MSQSLSNVLVHFVFSTKQRTPGLEDEWRDELHRYINGIIFKTCAMKLISINSVNDHVHLLMPLPRTITISDLMKSVKMGSSAWIHQKSQRHRLFQWQRGYGAFSVSPSHKLELVKYISNQAEHHKSISFQDEFRRLLGLYGIEYNEAYVWD